MNENYESEFDMDELEAQRRIKRQRRRKRAAFQRILFLVILILAAAALIALGIRAVLIKTGAVQIGGQGSGSVSLSLQTEEQLSQTEGPIGTGTNGSDASSNGQISADGASSDGQGSADGVSSDGQVNADGASSDGQTNTDSGVSDSQEISGTPTSEPSDSSGTQAALSSEITAILEQADLLAMGYDYDGAIELLKTIPSYESYAEVTGAISEYEATKATCVAVDVTTVPHIFYHSLINDTDRAFNVSVLGQFAVDGMNAWMTTVEEFDKITQTMYDNGYVFVRLRDLVVETTNADGSVTFTPNTSLMLPPDKKAVVLSVDDLSYYHSYEDAGFPDKLVLDENGDVKCHYVTADGTEQIGDFDVVPRLNTFLEEHPDGAYKGARGMIALTGYNGVFGYRTDYDYEAREHLMKDQQEWLDEHSDFDRATEIAEATKIAEALKESGWEFASHTWGHLSVTNKTLDELIIDNEKWVNNVQNIVGAVDTIIFAHGNDIGSWEGYSDDNEVYQYFKSAGYNFYCNVDSSQPYWVQITSDYVRQGRIDLDGYQLYQSSQGNTTVLDNMFLASQVFDTRRPTPVVANGES